MKKQVFFRTIAVMLVVVMTFGKFAFLPEKVKAETGSETEEMAFGLYTGSEEPIATTSVENDGVYTISYSGEAITVGPCGTMYIRQTEGNVADNCAAKINSIKINEIDYDVPSAWLLPSSDSVAEINDEYIIDMAFYNRLGTSEYNIGDGTGDDLNDLEITDIEVSFELCELTEYEYEITDDNTIELIQYTGTKKNIVIPEEIGGLTVSRIAGSLFEVYTGVETITIPDSVTSIEPAAFSNCFQLQSISVSEDNTAYSSEDGVLYSKEKDKLVKYPATKADICFLDSVTQIGEYAFAGCQLIRYPVIPDGITTIGVGAFEYGTGLKAIMIPASVIDMEDDAIYQCDDITIYGYASTQAEIYADDNSIPFVDMTDKVLITDCDIELDKTEFGYEEEFNPHVTVKYFDEVLTEGEDFEVELNQPYVTVKGINDYTWINRIETTTQPKPWTYKVLSDGTVEIAPNGPWAETTETLVIPDTIDGYKVTGVGAFRENLYSEYVVVPEGVTYIADNAFSLCSSLRGISLPSSLKSIGDGVFNECDDLQEIILPNGLEQIGKNIFNQCSNLTTVIISAGTSDVRGDIFVGCSSLESIQVDENNENYASINGVLYNKDFTELIFCPVKVPDIEIPETVTEIGEYAFYGGYRKISDIELPDGVEKIGDHTFGFCYSLSTITVPETVTYIGDQAFTECNKLIMLGYSGSYAESYATEHGISFIDIGTYTPLFKCRVSIDENLYYYDGENKKPLVTVKYNDIVLEENVDYSVEYTGNTDIGSGTVTITGLGKYVGTVNRYFCIIPQDAESGGMCAYIDGLITPSYTYVVKSDTNTITAGIVAGEDCGDDYSFNDWVKHIIKVTDTSGNVSYYSFGGSYATWGDDMDGDGVSDVGGADSDQWLGTVVDHKAQLSIPVAGKGTTVEFYCNAWMSYDGTQFVVYITGDRKTITDDMITIDQTEYVYDDTAKTPGVTVKYGDKELVKDTDYTISYNDNKDAGTAAVTITGYGNYRGTVTRNFVINKAEQTLVANISKNEITVGDTAEISADGKGNITYSSDNGKVATVDSNGIVKGISAGTAVITVSAEGDNNYESDAATITVKVKAAEPVKINLSDCTVTLGTTSYFYDGAAKKPSVTVKYGTQTLVSGTDYTVTYSKNTALGTATATITGKGNYTGKIVKNFTIKLATPTLSSVANSSTGVTVKWGKVSGASGYYVYRKTSGTSWTRITEIKSGNTVSYTDTTAKAGTTYTYTVKAYRGDYTSGYNTTGKTIKRLTNPTLSSAINASTGITVKWSKVTGAGGYYVYRKTSGTSWTRIAEIKSGSTVSYTDKTAKAGTTYTYTVKAYSGSYTSSYNNTGKTMKRLTTPALSSSTNASTGITVKWGKVTGASGYYVYRKSGTGSWSKITTITSGSTVSYTDKTAKAGTTYTYTVKAYSGSYTSSYNDAGKTMKRLTTPALSSAANASTGITVKWGKVTGASGYYVYRKTGTGSWSRIAEIKSGSTVSYTDKTAKAGTTYTYTVKAYSGSYTSSYNNTGKTMKRLTTPALSSSTNASTGITVKWGKVTGASGYYVYRKSGTGSWSKITTITSGSTVSYTDKTAKAGTTYTYTVKAYSGSYTSSYNDAGKTMKRLTTPALSSAANASTGITVKWGKVTGASGYYVYRKTGTGSWSKIATIKSGSTVSYTDKSAKAGTTYTYTVRAYSGNYVSSYSASGKSAKRVVKPTITSISNVTAGVLIRWNEVAEADGYYVYRKTGTGGWQQIGTVKNVSTVAFTDVGVKKGTTYYYTIKAYSGFQIIGEADAKKIKA